jgi:hypothetical protein
MDTWKRLLRSETLEKLQANYREQLPHKGRKSERDFEPVCKLFNPTGGGTWLLTECDEDGLAFGLADMGYPEMGYVSMDELAEFKGLGGLGIEEDIHFRATKPLSEYAREAHQLGYIRP